MPKKGRPKIDLPYWTDLRKVWYSMCHRCNNSNNSNYHNYGGRGIKVCNKWKNNFESFYIDCLKPYSDYIDFYGEKPTIDRINNDGDYEPSNCRWLSQDDNFTNSTSYKGNYEPKTLYPFRDL